MRTGLTKQEKTAEIYFDEKDPTIFIRTQNTDLKNRLTAYSRKHPAVCKLTDVDPDLSLIHIYRSIRYKNPTQNSNGTYKYPKILIISF